MFSFTTTVNQRFMHGVPRAQSAHGPAPRFSVIAWGKRRTINPQNAGSDELQKEKEKESSRPSRPLNTSTDKQSTTASHSYGGYGASEPEKEKEIAMDIKEVTALVDKWVLSQTEQQARQSAPALVNNGRSRVQGGWASNQRGGKQGAPTLPLLG